MKRIKKGDLMPWFLEDHGQLPKWYLDDTEKFFKSIKPGPGLRPQAHKRPSLTDKK
jgi:hypothetical protein